MYRVKKTLVQCIFNLTHYSSLYYPIMSKCNIPLNQEQIKSKIFFLPLVVFLKLPVLESHAIDTAEKTEGSAVGN